MCFLKWKSKEVPTLCPRQDCVLSVLVDSCWRKDWKKVRDWKSNHRLPLALRHYPATGQKPHTTSHLSLREPLWAMPSPYGLLTFLQFTFHPHSKDSVQTIKSALGDCGYYWYREYGELDPFLKQMFLVSDTVTLSSFLFNTIITLAGKLLLF